MQNLSAPFNAMRINGIISPDLETTNKKKYNAMESVLQEIQKAIQLPNDEVTRHNVIVKEILDAIIEELKATDPLFKLIYQKTLYGGSYYDGLKLNAPDEYDIDLALRLKDLNPCLEISDIAGFVRVKVNLDKLKQKSNYADYRSVEKFIDGHNYLLTEKFREWFEGLVCKAKINIERKGSKHKFDLIKSGPAFTLKLKIGNKLVCVDLVPSIIFENDKWPPAPFKKNGTKKGEFLVVPKTPPNCSRYNTAWRLSFQDQEREIINGKNGLKDTIRLLKLLRSAQFQENSFPSYYIKTVMMLMIEVVDASFWSNNSRSYIFMMGLKYFSKLLENQQLPYYWNRSYNLLSAKKGITLENWSKRIDRIFKTLEKNLDSPSLRPEMLKFFDDDNEAAAQMEGIPNTLDSGEAEATAEGKPKRTRKRQRKDWKREERKRKRNSGNSYITGKGKIIAKKQFSNLDCKCRKQKMAQVRNHITSFPAYESHYTRKHNPNRKYLSENLNRRLMYNLYKEHVESQGCQPVKEHIYRRIFNKEFNLQFHAPHKDTCVKCDVFSNKLKYSTDEEEKRQLKQDHELHLRKAEKARDSLKADAEKSANNDSYYAFSFDLEKSLPFPKLVCQQAYYKRNMYVYNLGCHELSTKMGFMFCWDEVNGSKGSQEISSCLIKHLKSRAPEAKHVVMYSDTCTGQNRNWKIAMTLMKYVQSPENMVEIIDQKFLQSGHSFLPNHSDFASIENFSKSQQIYTPDDWYRAIAMSRKKNAFKVTVMTIDDFLSVENIMRKISKRKKDCEGHPVSWIKMQWIRYQKSEPFKILFKETISEEMPFSALNFMPTGKKGRPVNVCNIDQGKLYASARPVTKEKKKDMMDLLPYIPPINHIYFQRLVTSENAEDVGPLQEESDNE